jgi:hypothetical protein
MRNSDYQEFVGLIGIDLSRLVLTYGARRGPTTPAAAMTMGLSKGQ